MSPKITFFVLGMLLLLFSGCISQNKYRGLETELKSAQTQMGEDEIAFKNIQAQNEKLLNENIQLIEEIEDLKLELAKDNMAVAQNDGVNSKQDTWVIRLVYSYPEVYRYAWRFLLLLEKG